MKQLKDPFNTPEQRECAQQLVIAGMQDGMTVGIITGMIFGFVIGLLIGFLI